MFCTPIGLTQEEASEEGDGDLQTCKELSLARKKKYSHIYVLLLRAFKVAPFFHSVLFSLSSRSLCDSPLSKYYEGESSS
jgi:hypothetical protein